MPCPKVAPVRRSVQSPLFSPLQRGLAPPERSVAWHKRIVGLLRVLLRPRSYECVTCRRRGGVSFTSKWSPVTFPSLPTQSPRPSKNRQCAPTTPRLPHPLRQTPQSLPGTAAQTNIPKQKTRAQESKI